MPTKLFATVMLTCIAALTLSIAALTMTKAGTEEAEKRADEIGSRSTVCDYRLDEIKEDLSEGEKAHIPRECFTEDGRPRFKMEGSGRYVLRTSNGFIRTTA